MHTDRMLYHCTILQYNHKFWHGGYAEAKFKTGKMMDEFISVAILRLWQHKKACALPG